MSFTCDEVWLSFPKMGERAESVHLALFPGDSEILGPAAGVQANSHAGDWVTLRRVRDEVLKALEEARGNKLICGGLEAQGRATAADPIQSGRCPHHAEM